MRETDCFLLNNMMTNKMSIFLNMLGSFMENWIIGNLYDAFIITDSQYRGVTPLNMNT